MSTEDAYLAARKEWDDRFAGQRRTVRFLATVSLLSLAIGVTGGIYGMWATVNARFVPYLVVIDDIGRAALAPSPQVISDWPEHVIKRELETFIERIRTITPDRSLLGENHQKAMAYLDSGEAAFRKLTTYFREPRNDPLERAKTVTVSSDVTTVNYLGGQSWRVEWTERSYERASGKELDTRRYVATLVVAWRQVRDLALLQVNPLGLFITDLDIQELRP
jgi:type IV secretion system protein VirB5